MAEQDEINIGLGRLEIPEPTSNAVHRIMVEAQQTKRKQINWLNKPRQLRAFIYVPSTRFAIMAAVVALFIGVGLMNRVLAPTEEQAIAFEPEAIPDDLLLYDLELVEDDNFDNLFEG